MKKENKSLIEFLITKAQEFQGDPIKSLLKLTGISKNPTVQLSVALISIYAAAAIIKSIKIDAEFPLKSMLIMLFLMMLIFVFSGLTRTKDKLVKVAGYILMYSVVLSTASITITGASAIITGKPKAFADRFSTILGISELVQVDMPDNDLLMKTIYSRLTNLGRSFVAVQNKQDSLHSIDLIAKEGVELANQALHISQDTLSVNKRLTRLAFIGFGYGLSAQALSVDDSGELKNKLRGLEGKKINEYASKGTKYLDQALEYFEEASNYTIFQQNTSEYKQAISFRDWATSSKQGAHTFPRFIRYQKAILIAVQAWTESNQGEFSVSSERVFEATGIINSIDSAYLRENPASGVLFLSWLCAKSDKQIGEIICLQ